MQPTAYTPTQLPERIAAKIRVDPESGCWVWVASIHPNGYGRLRWEGSMHPAHRVVYALLAGNPGPILDHRCFNHACVNPEHLRPVTAKQNQEHRQGANVNSRSGIRGVTLRSDKKAWWARVRHNGKHYHGGYYKTITEAEQAVIALRSYFFTHDDT